VKKQNKKKALTRTCPPRVFEPTQIFLFLLRGLRLCRTRTLPNLWRLHGRDRGDDSGGIVDRLNDALFLRLFFVHTSRSFAFLVFFLLFRTTLIGRSRGRSHWLSNDPRGRFFCRKNVIDFRTSHCGWSEREVGSLARHCRSSWTGTDRKVEGKKNCRGAQYRMKRSRLMGKSERVDLHSVGRIQGTMSVCLFPPSLLVLG
jgi:hypothetical protein